LTPNYSNVPSIMRKINLKTVIGGQSALGTQAVTAQAPQVLVCGAEWRGEARPFGAVRAG
jgi:hypothetical protein